jgi:hypothetical protein
MPSLFTSNGGIELPADGEQDGVWGDTVNANMQIIDRLTNGVGAITLSGTTHTLTTLNGTPSDGHYAVVVFGGTPSGTNTVTIAPNDAEKVYFVRNTTAQSVVLTQGSGGDVTVTAGAGAIVYADGAGTGAAVVDLTSTLIPDLAAAGITASPAEINILDGATVTPAELNILDGATLSTADLNILDGATVTTAELNLLTGVTLVLADVTATAAELNILDGVTASTAELNILDGVTATTAELNFVDGVTSPIQTQIAGRAPIASPVFTGDVTLSDTAPEFVLIDTNGTSGLSQTAIVQNGDQLQFETRNSAGVFVGRDYVIEKASVGADNHIFYLNNAERFRITTTGAIGLNGENYGSSGQVLTSGGLAATPSWQSVTTPAAFGRINTNNSTSASYNIASADWYDTGKCRVTFTTSLGTSSYVATVSLNNTSAGAALVVWAYPSITAGGSFVDVYVKNTSGTSVTSAFQIVCFKP